MLPALCLGACVSERGTQGGQEVPEIRAATAQLVRAQSCDDLLGEIQADAIARVDQLAQALRDPDQGVVSTASRGEGATDTPGSAVGAPLPIAPAGNPAVSAPQSAGPGDPGSNGGFAGEDGAEEAAPTERVAVEPDPGAATEEVEGPEGYSETNRQVAEIDEADIVKVDEEGRAVYLLHGDRLLILKSWPADESEVRSELKLSTGLGARPYEMFVKDGRVAVFSAVEDSQVLRAASSEDDSSLPVPARNTCFGCSYHDSSFTKVTLIDASGDAPEITRELFFDGVYVSSRRYDDRLRAVIRGGFKAPRLYEPSIEYRDPWGKLQPQAVIDDQIDAWKERTVASILATTLDDWLPNALERKEDELSPLARNCESYYIPAPGMVSYGMTSVVELSLTDDEGPIGGAVVLGDAALVYSNASALVVAHGDYGRRFQQQSEQPGERTILHWFELGEEGGVDYGASGYVAGHVLNQFSMDVQDDLLRVTTVERRWDVEDDESRTDNRLRVLRAEGTELSVIGESRNLGKPNEEIRSTRFVGDLAYVVTFERIDPLVVVSLEDPEAPEVLGEVEIPGFSTYMHPLDEGHLLTIGEFVDPQNGGNRALQLQIFDVTDPTAPRKAESYLFPTGGNSLASQEHKAFTFYDEQSLLAFPYVDWNTARSTLEVFRVSAEKGFTRLGAVDHSRLFENCYRWPEDAGDSEFGITPNAMADFPPDVDPAVIEEQMRFNAFHACPGQGVRRGLFIDDYVWSFSYGGVLVHSLEELAEDSSAQDAIARIDLERPLYSDWTGNGGFGGFEDFGGGFAIPDTMPGFAAPQPASPPVMMGTGTPATSAPEPEPAAVDGGVDSGVDIGAEPVPVMEADPTPDTMDMAMDMAMDAGVAEEG